MFDVCTMGDTVHINTIFKFCHTCVNMSASIFFAAATIRAFRSGRSHGNGGTNTFAYFARNARCTVTTELLVWYSTTQNDFSPGAAIFSLPTLASPSGRNVNYDEKQFSGEKKFRVVPSICTGFVNTCPTVFLKSFRSHYSPGVDSASNRNEYQEHFLGVKAAGA